MPNYKGTIVPKNIQFRFDTGRCNGRPSDQIPFNYFYNYQLSSDPNFSNIHPNQSTKIFNDDAIAVYNAGNNTPLNQTALQNLAKQFAQDWLLWFNYKYDITYNGIINPKIDSTIDTIEITHTSSDITTRVKTGEYNDWIRKLSHWDAYFYSNCGDVYSNNALNMVTSSGTPSFKRYIPTLARHTAPIVPPVFTKCYDTIVDAHMMRGQYGGIATDPTKPGCDPCCQTKLCTEIAFFVDNPNENCPLVYEGSVVTITRQSNGDIFYCENFSLIPGTTPIAICCINLPHDVANGEKFTVHIDTSLYGSCSRIITINRCNKNIVSFTAYWVSVSGCSRVAHPLGDPISGMHVTFITTCGTSNCTTDANGICCFENVLSLGLSDTLSFHDPNGYFKDITIPWDGTLLFSNGGALIPVDTKVCSCGCNLPINKTLYLTYSGGTIPIIYQDFVSGSKYTGWCGLSLDGHTRFFLYNNYINPFGSGSNPNCFQLSIGPKDFDLGCSGVGGALYDVASISCPPAFMLTFTGTGVTISE